MYGPKRTIAWRVLDAQYFGLAQRRRRVFVVASARDGFDPTEVLFEREGVRRDTAPRRGEGQDVTGTAPFGPALQCGCGHIFGEELGPYGCVNCEGDEGPAVSVFGGIPAFGGHSLGRSVERSATLTAKDSRLDMESETFFVVPPIDASYGRLHGCSHQDANHGHSHLVVHGTQDPCVSIDQAHALGRNSGQENALLDRSSLRRLTPVEFERLQGMPDDYTLIPWRGKRAEDCPDGPRYKAIGNSKAVTVVRWIGQRILRQITPSPYG